MATLSGVAAQGPGASFPGNSGEAGRAAGKAGRTSGTSYWHVR